MTAPAVCPGDTVRLADGTTITVDAIDGTTVRGFDVRNGGLRTPHIDRVTAQVPR